MVVTFIADSLGIGEGGLRLLIAQLSAYPINFAFLKLVRHRSDVAQHFFFAVTGMFMAWWALGVECIVHSLVCVCTTWATLSLMRPTFWSTVALFIFNLGYLFAGYIFVNTTNYDVSWTMPQCVLCLKLIGLAIDVYDAERPEKSLSKNEKARAISRENELPSLLETLAFIFYIGAYMIGPQIFMRKFRTFISNNQTDKPIQPDMIQYGLKRLALGLVYICSHVFLQSWLNLPEHIVTTDEFLNGLSFANFRLGPFIYYSVLFTIWAKLILAKYVGMWLIAEGGCVISGIATETKVDENGKCEADHSLMTNVHLMRYETSYRSQHLVDSFNINTNAWVAHYVYKRMRGFNNKYLSQVCVLVFLAVWHGFHSGYYVIFFYEFITLISENQFFAMLQKSSKFKSLMDGEASQLATWTWQGFLGIFHMMRLPHYFAPFVLLVYSRYGPLIQATWCLPLTTALLWFFIGRPLLSYLLAERHDVKKD